MAQDLDVLTVRFRALGEQLRLVQDSQRVLDGPGEWEDPPGAPSPERIAEMRESLAAEERATIEARSELFTQINQEMMRGEDRGNENPD